MAETISSFPRGQLDHYRVKASFDWKKLKLFIFGVEELRYMHNLYQELKKHPEFHPIRRSLSFDEQRHLSMKQFAIIRANEDKLFCPKYHRFATFTADSILKHTLEVTIFRGIIKRLGTERHAQYLKQIDEGQISGSFALTEVAHGSNVRAMRTTATYDKNTKEFTLHTPDFQAAKCLAEGLGLSATHVLLNTPLIVEGKNYGLHTFIVPIRDPETLVPYPNLTVGDMGEKMGLNGVDNGFLLFHSYRIPRENLINKNGDVTEDGHYISPIEDESKRFGAALMSLSTSRVNVIISNDIYGGHALTVAVRYAAVRRQFGPDKHEIPILEYETHQYRLLPHLAAVYVFKVFGRFLDKISNTYVENPDSVSDNVEKFAIELHVITSAAKPVTGWTMRDAIQSCREACAGHGYLKAAGLGDIKNNQEACLTYEGENWVLIQQVGNFLLKLWPEIVADKKFSFPLKSVNFLNNAKIILSTGKFTVRTVTDLCKPETIFNLYQWMISYLLKQTYEKVVELAQSDESSFSIKNKTQVFYSKRLSIAYIEHFFLQKFLEKILECTEDRLRSVLLNIFSLYGLYNLENNLSVFYQGGYACGEQLALLVQNSIVALCGELKNEAVSLVDVIAPPDFVLNSVLGTSDGQVYRNLEDSFYNSPYGLSRPSWWRDIVKWKSLVPKAESKL